LINTVARNDLGTAQDTLVLLGIKQLGDQPSLRSAVDFTRALIDSEWPAIQLIAHEHSCSADSSIMRSLSPV
jgi:hypothetical protein